MDTKKQEAITRKPKDEKLVRPPKDKMLDNRGVRKPSALVTK